MATAIRPTTTQRVRSFLAEQGIPLRPWTKLDETYAALYGLMRARSEDNSFWKPLSGLLRDVVADAADGPSRLPARQAELLRSWDVEELVRDLRCALPGRCAPAGDHLGFVRTLGAPVLGGFLVLGLAAAGCDEVAGDPPEWAEGCSLSDGSEIYAAIDENDSLSADEKTGLCTCMASMQTDWQSDLSGVFESCSPELIAYALETIVDRCNAEGGDLTGNPTDDVDNMCYGAAYKGVTFPS